MIPLPRGPMRHVALFLNGERVGDLRGVQGLQMEADVVTNDLGVNVSKKHISTIRWTPALVSLGMGMGAAFAAWLHSSLAGSALQLSGQIVVSDANSRARSGVVFTGALLTKFTVPALDASSNESSSMTVEFQAEQVSVVKGDGSDTRSRIAASKPWFCSGFRIEIGSLPCAHVMRMEALTWTVSADVVSNGEFRKPTIRPGRVVISDWQLSIASTDFAAWASAAQKWFVGGAHLEADEMAGCLTLLANDSTELAALSLSGVGFCRFPSLDLAANGRFVVTLYMEAMSFDLKV